MIGNPPNADRTVDATLRQATDTDLPGILTLLGESDLPTEGVAETLGGFIVAEHDATIVGVIGVETCRQYGLLRSAAVRAAWRGRGLGRLLVERAIALAESRGFDALYLLTTSAEQYFPSFGFVQTEREAVPDAVRETAEFRSICPSSATVMTRPLKAVG